MALLFAGSLVSVWRMYRASARQPEPLFHLRFTSRPAAPFTFLNIVFINPELHESAVLPAIIRHEQAHARQWHGIDLLLAELNRVFYWFNPGAWLIKSAVRENLEFIADERAVRLGGDIKAYQYQLLHAVTAVQPGGGITSRFAFYQLKNRIMMMNKKRSGRGHHLRYLLLLPLVLIVMVVAARHRTEQAAALSKQAQNPPATGALRMADTLPHKVVEEAMWKQAEYNSKGYIVYVRTNNGRPLAVAIDRSGKTAAKLLLNAGDKAVKDFEKKYGSIPPPPPPPVKPGNGVIIEAGRVNTEQHNNGHYTIYTDTLIGISHENQDARKRVVAGRLPDALYVLNGETVTKEYILALAPATISSISVLKNEQAVKKYGEAGLNGAIEVELKKTEHGEVVVMGQAAGPFSAADTVPLRPTVPDVYIKVQQQAEFIGSFRKFLEQNLRYPSKAQDQGIQGTVTAQFIVDLNGRVSDIGLDNRSPVKNALLFQEVKRILTISSGNWRPAMRDGKPVKSWHSQPVTFVLQEVR
jgi:TonB family protein